MASDDLPKMPSLEEVMRAVDGNWLESLPRISQEIRPQIDLEEVSRDVTKNVINYLRDQYPTQEFYSSVCGSTNFIKRSREKARRNWKIVGRLARGLLLDIDESPSDARIASVSRN